MLNEEIEMYLKKAPSFIVNYASFAIFFTACIMKLVIINGLSVPVIYKDFQLMYQCAMIFSLLAVITSAVVVLKGVGSVFTRVCRWLGILFFALAVCILFICALFSTDLPVPLIFRNSLGMFRIAVVFFMLSFLAAFHAWFVNRDCIPSTVCGWLTILFFFSGHCILVICARFSTEA